MRQQSSCCRLPEPVSEVSDLTGFDLTISSGGAAAVLGGTGAVVGAQLAGLHSWRRLGGVSGGSLVSAMVASGLDSNELLRLATESRFAAYLTASHGLVGFLPRMFGWKFGAPEHNRPHQANCRWNGLFGSDNLGLLVEKVIMDRGDKQAGLFCPAAGGTRWPLNLWTMATTRDGSQVVFDKEGVHMVTTNGHKFRISDEVAAVGTALRASCTIPGIMASVDYRGIRLYDGAMSRDGICPVGLQIRHFGADPSKVIAVRIGEDLHKPILGRIHTAARVLCGVHPDFHWGPETEGVIECRPQIDHVHTLKFVVSDDEKWLAILIGFEAMLSQLALNGILQGERLLRARSILKCIGFWRDAIPQPIGRYQPLAQRIKSCFTEHGLLAG